MAAYKKNKTIKSNNVPRERYIAQGIDQEKYYNEHPTWSFSSADQDMWSFSREHVGDKFWDDIFPVFRSLETQTWSEILVRDKKKNHAINVNDLNKGAQDRLAARFIEAEALISLRINATHRLYGYMTGSVFNVLWYDDKHGDNKECVCRSNKKHT